MCEPKLFAVNNDDVDDVGKKSARVPLTRASCLNPCSTLNETINKWDYRFRQDAQLKLETKRAKRREKIAAEGDPKDDYEIQLLPDYHSPEFQEEARKQNKSTQETQEMSETNLVPKQSKNERERQTYEETKKEILTKLGKTLAYDSTAFFKRISPELHQLVDPCKFEKVETAEKPQNVTFRIRDPRKEMGEPLIADEAVCPEITTYIRQVANSDSPLKTMYGMNFKLDEAPKKRPKTKKNSYDILVPTVLEGILTKLITRVTLSEEELGLFGYFIAVAGNIDPEDMKKFFKILLARGVVLAQAVIILQNRLMNLKSFELSTKEVEVFLNDLRKAALYGDPQADQKKRIQLAMEHAKRLKEALEEADLWADALLNPSKYKGKKDALPKKETTDGVGKDVLQLERPKSHAQKSETGQEKKDASQTKDGGSASTSKEDKTAKDDKQMKQDKTGKEDKSIKENKLMKDTVLKDSKGIIHDAKHDTTKTVEDKGKKSKESTSPSKEKQDKLEKPKVEKTTASAEEKKEEKPEPKLDKVPKVADSSKSKDKKSSKKVEEETHSTHHVKKEKEFDEKSVLDAGDKISVRSLRPGAERDFRTKLAAAFLAAQKYADKTLSPDGEPSDYREHKHLLGTEFFDEEAHRGSVKKLVTPYDDTMELKERYSLESKGAYHQGYYEPWDAEFPWSDIQERIAEMQEIFIKPQPDPKFIFRRGMEYYQALFRREGEKRNSIPKPSSKTAQPKGKAK